jgi:hypothetical protein
MLASRLDPVESGEVARATIHNGCKYGLRFGVAGLYRIARARRVVLESQKCL